MVLLQDTFLSMDDLLMIIVGRLVVITDEEVTVVDGVEEAAVAVETIVLPAHRILVGHEEAAHRSLGALLRGDGDSMSPLIFIAASLMSKV